MKLVCRGTDNNNSRMTEPDNFQRKSVRVVGPFDGVRPGIFDMPVQIYDLSTGGCFVNSVHDAPPRGHVFTINIDLPTGDTIVAKCETASVRPGFGYGVQFCQMSEDCRARLLRAIELIKESDWWRPVGRFAMSQELGSRLARKSSHIFSKASGRSG